MSAQQQTEPLENGKVKQDEKGVNIINGTEIPSPSVSPNVSRSNSPSRKQDGDKSKPKRFMNGWTKEQEKLMADWADICTVYKWCHQKAEQRYHTSGLILNLVIIVISSLAGFSNIGVQSLFEGNAQAIKFASFGIGGISLLSSLLTTIGNTLKWIAQSESHRVAGIGWGKFGRQISVELALHPNERMDSLDFLKICRAELDRLIEQSPQIPVFVINEFEKKFGHITDLKRPEICGRLEHTKVYESSQERLKNLAVEASLMLRRKKDMLKELLSPDVEERIANQVNLRLEKAIEERKKSLEEEIELKRKEEEDKRRLADKLIEERKAQIQEEITLAKKKLEQDLAAEKMKLEEKEKLLHELAGERKKQIEEEIELEKKKLEIATRVATGIDEGATAPSIDKLVANSFENRINMNRSTSRSRSQSVRRKSHIGDGIYTLETLHNNPKGTIRVSDMGAQITIKDKEEYKNEIIIVSKD